jgi:hypothetical protein
MSANPYLDRVLAILLKSDRKVTLKFYNIRSKNRDREVAPTEKMVKYSDAIVFTFFGVTISRIYV